ncbi:MAG: exo-alpha-sialidase, partial [Planctomycetes bacterium]|nr:exo-alpha-sialidase [Planctomycetota bacterium]
MKQLISRTRQLVRSTHARRWALLLTAIGLPAATLVALDSSLHASEAHAVRDGAPQAKPDSKAAAAPVVPGDKVAPVRDVDAPADPRDRGLDSRAPSAIRSRMVGPPIGGSIWVSQGAGPAQFGQIENIVPDGEVVGAVHSLLAHPVSADILYLGGVNGGVWKTTNATAMSPTWVPLTDLENGLSIGALEFDPTDVTHQTLVAGIGRFSSFGRAGPFRTGILRTTDGGTTWAAFDGGGVLLDKNISGVAARGSTIVVSVNFAVPFDFPEIGIFRSVDGGVTFTQVSTGDGTATGLPGGLSFDLEVDPTSTSTLYTNMNFADSVGGVNGIYKSTDFGATWTKVSNPTMDALILSGSTSNIEMSIGNAGQIYVAILNFGQLRNGGVFRSGDGGATWVTMDIPLTNEGGTDVGTNPTFKPDAGEPGSQGSIHFSIQADPSNPNIVYVGGDRQPSPLPNSIGAQNFTGRLFRGDASLPPGSQWVHLTHSNVLGAPGGGTASSSAPHADSRELVLDVNGDLIECDDGGIYRRTFPQSNTGDWFSIIGNLTVTEFHDIAYDNNSQVIIGGTQDNGTLLQNAPGGITWQNILGGDGGDVAVDDTSLPGFSIRYFSSQFLGGFSRATYDAANNLVQVDFPTLTLVGGGAALRGQYATPIPLSSEAQTQLVIGGGSSVYESLDQGDTIREIGAGIRVNSTTAGNAMAYGGRLAGVPNPDVLYVAEDATVFRRTRPGSMLQFAGVPPASGIVRDVVIDPENWNRIYAITDFGVFVSTDAGTSWSDITGDLTGVQILRSGEFVTSAGEDGLVVGTNIGVFLSLRTALGTWNELGTNLPNVPVWDLDYDATDDVLVAGTLGRGAWTIPNASTTILPDCGSTACLGACCLTSTCTDSITEASCLGSGGTWFVGDTC